jgi:hypothetical protein
MVESSCNLTITIPKHYKKPRFLEPLKAVLTDEGAVNLECKASNRKIIPFVAEHLSEKYCLGVGDWGVLSFNSRSLKRKNNYSS